MVPLDFTSMEAGEQLWGNGMDRGKTRGGRSVSFLYVALTKRHIAVTASVFMQSASVLSAVPNAGISRDHMSITTRVC